MLTEQHNCINCVFATSITETQNATMLGLSSLLYIVVAFLDVLSRVEYGLHLKHVVVDLEDSG